LHAEARQTGNAQATVISGLLQILPDLLPGSWHFEKNPKIQIFIGQQLTGRSTLPQIAGIQSQ